MKKFKVIDCFCEETYKYYCNKIEDDARDMLDYDSRSLIKKYRNAFIELTLGLIVLFIAFSTLTLMVKLFLPIIILVDFIGGLLFTVCYFDEKRRLKEEFDEKLKAFYKEDGECSIKKFQKFCNSTKNVYLKQYSSNEFVFCSDELVLFRLNSKYVNIEPNGDEECTLTINQNNILLNF